MWAGDDDLALPRFNRRIRRSRRVRRICMFYRKLIFVKTSELKCLSASESEAGKQAE